MDTTKIQIAVARADMFLTRYGRTLLAVFAIVIIVFLAMLLDGGNDKTRE